MIKRLKSHQIATYLLLAFLLSWTIEVPLALQAQGWIRAKIPFSFHFLVGYGPLIAAMATTWLGDGPSGLRDLFSRMVRLPPRLWWWLVATTPFLLFFLILLLNGMLLGQWMSPTLIGEVNFLPGVGFGAIPLWILTFGVGEEVGWRGFLLPHLQRRRSALSASVLLWVFWGLWHLPLFFYSYAPGMLFGMLSSLLGASITLTWLYNSTRGSLPAVATFHGLFNASTACFTCGTSGLATTLSLMVILWAFFVVVQFKPENLSSVERQSIGIA